MAANVFCTRARCKACGGGGSGVAIDPEMPPTASTPPAEENSAAS